MGMSQQQYFKYEKGVNEMPVRYVVAFCKHYDVSADWLLGLKEEKKKTAGGCYPPLQEKRNPGKRTLLPGCSLLSILHYPLSIFSRVEIW